MNSTSVRSWLARFRLARAAGRIMIISSISVLAITAGFASAEDDRPEIDLTIEEIRDFLHYTLDADAGADVQKSLILNTNESLFLEQNLFLPGNGTMPTMSDPTRDS